MKLITPFFMVFVDVYIYFRIWTRVRNPRVTDPDPAKVPYPCGSGSTTLENRPGSANSRHSKEVKNTGIGLQTNNIIKHSGRYRTCVFLFYLHLQIMRDAEIPNLFPIHWYCKKKLIMLHFCL
jgi:hypothetical protein